MDRQRYIGKGFGAQFWSFDAIFAIIIFMSAITILSIAWLDVSNQLSIASGGTSYIMQLQAQGVAQNLLSAGSPSNWQAIVVLHSVSAWTSVGIGLASSPGSSSLSGAKLYALQSMVNYNYSGAGQALGTTYNYYITISGSSLNITLGENPTMNGAVTTFLSRRSAFLNGAPVQIEVFVWSSSTGSVS